MYGRSARLARGDYLRGARRLRGDPGLFGFIGKALGAVGGVVGGLLPGPAGAIVTKVSQAISGKPKAAAPTAAQAQMAALSMPGGAQTSVTTRSGVSVGGLTVGKTQTQTYSVATTPSGQQVMVARSRHRRIDPTNVKALRRALRREAGFIKLARRTGLVALPKATRVRRAARKRR